MTDYSKLIKLPAPCHWNVLLKLLKGGDHKDAMESLSRIQASFKAMKEALEKASGSKMVEEDEAPAAEVAPAADGEDAVAGVVAKVREVLQGMQDSDSDSSGGALEACRILAIGAACELGVPEDTRDSVVQSACDQLGEETEDPGDDDGEAGDQGEACKTAKHFLKKFKKAEKTLKR